MFPAPCARCPLLVNLSFSPFPASCCFPPGTPGSAPKQLLLVLSCLQELA